MSEVNDLLQDTSATRQRCWTRPPRHQPNYYISIGGSLVSRLIEDPAFVSLGGDININGLWDIMKLSKINKTSADIGIRLMRKSDPQLINVVFDYLLTINYLKLLIIGTSDHVCSCIATAVCKTLIFIGDHYPTKIGRSIIDNPHIRHLKIYNTSMIEHLYDTFTNKQNLDSITVSSCVNDGVNANDMNLLFTAMSNTYAGGLTLDNCKVFDEHYNTIYTHIAAMKINLLVINDRAVERPLTDITKFIDNLMNNFTITSFSTLGAGSVMSEGLTSVVLRNRKLTRNSVLSALTDICIAMPHLLEYPYVLLEIFDWTNPHYYMFWHHDKIRLIFRIKQSISKIRPTL